MPLLRNWRKKLVTKSDDKRVPTLRFKGFTDEWEQRKFTELGKLYYGKSAPKWSVVEKGGTPCIRYGELYTKYSSKIDNVYSHTSIDKSKLKFSTGNELLIPRVGEEPLDFAKHTSWLSIPNVAIGEMITVLKTKENPLFLANYLRAKYVFKFARLVEGGNVSNLYFERYEDTNILIPSKNEQQNISKLILKIDKLITLQQRKLSLIKTLKRSFLSDLFFKTSTNSIVITLKQVTSIRGGYAFKSKEFTENGYPIIKIANISNNGEIKGPYSYTNNFNKKYILTKNDIVLAMSGATTGKIAKLRSSKAFLQNQRIGYFCKTNNIDYNYLYYLLISDQFKKQLKRITIAGAQPNVSSSDIENFRFSVLSSKNKQKKISDFLNKLDTKIRITNKKITIFSQLKRSLLNNMFI